jgi:hypothetical protein
MAAILLHDKDDRLTERQVGDLLQTLAANPDNGISGILDRNAIKKAGGFPDAAYVVVLKPGYTTGAATSGNLVLDTASERGGHGFSPEFPQMRASFFIAGTGIARHRDLGIIDMRQIAPTLAGILNLQMPSATAAPLGIRP